VRISDAIIALTDRAMDGCYGELATFAADVDLLPREALEAQNLMCGEKETLRLVALLGDRFFLIAGSSNFHHLEVARLARLAERTAGPVHLLLIDRHMDAQEYRERDSVLTCGNWVPYAVRRGLVRSVTLCGCDDETRDPAFDREILDDGRIAHHPDLSAPLDARLFEGCATYVSVDTDILAVPSDWGRGEVALSDLLAAPLWAQLANTTLCGAGIMGHVTDGRYAADMLATAWRRRGLVGSFSSFSELWADFAYGLLPKLRAGFARPLPLERQFEIVRSIYEKIAETARPPLLGGSA